MTDETEVLVRLLAETDAIFAPVRDTTIRRRGQTQVARQQFADAGAAYKSGKAGATDRKAAERALAAAVNDGLVIAFRSNRITTGVALTDRGEALARATVGLTGFAVAWETLGKLKQLTKARPTLLTDVWISEERLTGRKWGSKGSEREFVLLEYDMLPGLIRGLAESNSDLRGHAYYRLTEAGRQALAREAPADSDAVKDAEAFELYKSLVRNAIAQFGLPSENCREIGLCPLPVAIVGVSI